MAMETVSIGCKLPHGLKIALGGLEETSVEGKTVKMFRPNGRHINLNGYHTQGAAVMGVGMTHDVDAAAWRDWAERNKDFEPLSKGLIFEFKRQSDAAPMARELANVKSGFEGIDPDKPGRNVSKSKD